LIDNVASNYFCCQRRIQDLKDSLWVGLPRDGISINVHVEATRKHDKHKTHVIESNLFPMRQLDASTSVIH